MSLVFEIVALQEIDDRIAALYAALAAVNERLSRNQQLDDARRSVQHVEDLILKAEREQRRLEGEVADLTAKIEPEEKKLFSGSVKSPKELVNLQHEVDLLKGARAKLEDSLLTVMSRVESLQPRRSAARTAMAEMEKETEAAQQELRSEARRLEGELDAESQRRSFQAQQIQPRPLHQYEEIRKRKSGTGVARLIGSSCGGCRVTLPEAVRKQVLLRDAITQCPNCEKILAPG